MLLFQKRFLAGLVGGTITLTIRQWARSHVKPGARYRVHPIGVVEVDTVTSIPFSGLTEADARRAGFTGLAELHAWMAPFAKQPLTPRTPVWRVELRHVGDGDRIDLAMETQLSNDQRAALSQRLARLDSTPHGPWVRDTLRSIARRPRVAASRLAKSLGRETQPFKADVRKLKRLGLTISFEVGYELSPRCRAFLARRPRWEALTAASRRAKP